MPDEVGELVERECSYPDATQASVWAALDQAADRWEKSAKSDKRSREERTSLRRLVDRAGRILYFFHHGYLGGNFTPDDERLVTLLKALRPDAQR
jgi:hypothetical protein